MSVSEFPAPQNATEVIDGNSGNFFASGLRAKVDQLMNVLWAGGVNNPMDSIEQLSYLIFMRLLWERDEQAAIVDRTYSRIFSGPWARYGWGNFVTLTGDELFDSLRESIEKLYLLPGLSATGNELFRNATLKIYDRGALRAVVQVIDNLDLVSRDGSDLKGDMYEYLLSKLSQSGTNGQFRTPRHIVDVIVKLLDPDAGMRVCDPACGTAGFLISASKHILRKYTLEQDVARGQVDGRLLRPAQWKFLEQQGFTGYDNDSNMVKIAIMNLYLHRLERATVEYHNPLTSSRGGRYPGPRFDMILANPPFAGRVQKESILSEINLDTRETELLFLKWFVDHLADNGKAGVIVPIGVLFGSSKADRRMREILLTTCEVSAVVTLPSGVFKPYSVVSTAVLVFKKTGSPTRDVWFYEVSADGFSLDDKRTPTSRNDLPDLVQKWPDREAGANSFVVDIDTIRANGWQLLPSKYKEFEPNLPDVDPPGVVLDRLIALEQEIRARAEDLRRRFEDE